MQFNRELWYRIEKDQTGSLVNHKWEGLLIRAMAILSSILFCTTVSAVPVLDQSNQATTSATQTTAPLAQTFTVGIEGILARVEMEIDLIDIDFELAILGTTAGLPDASKLLGTFTLPDTIGFEDMAIDVSGAGIAVGVGDLLAIAVSDGNKRWRATVQSFGQPDYLNGRAFISFPGGDWRVLNVSGGVDFEFRTFVTTQAPEPTTLALLGLGLAGIVISKRKSNS